MGFLFPLPRFSRGVIITAPFNADHTGRRQVAGELRTGPRPRPAPDALCPARRPEPSARAANVQELGFHGKG